MKCVSTGCCSGVGQVRGTEFGISLCGIRDIVLDIEKYEFLVLGIKFLILLGIISLIPPVFTRHLYSNWNRFDC